MITRQEIADYIDHHDFPNEADFVEFFGSTEGRYTDVECDLWDFKREWPFSYSDEYFGGIARLACAFANTRGGYIIFGVHDEKRTGGHNRVHINLDKLTKSFSQLLNIVPKLDVKRYEASRFGAVVVLLIGAQGIGADRIVFQSNLEKYPKGVIWIRQDNEVVPAEPRHVPILYLGVSQTDRDSELPVVLGQIPPNPATLKKFIGRLEVLDKLFHWFFKSDEPRLYLWGKGGSGKTAIAYEFARQLRKYGGNVTRIGDEPGELESVVFVSAKERLLEVESAAIQPSDSADFVDEKSLYLSILRAGGWTDNLNTLNSLDIHDLKKSVAEFFRLSCCLLVIDDIDTLSTKGIETGSDYLFKSIAKSGKNSKILYTMRNLPTASIGNSIEVPGLKKGNELQQFVDACVAQYNVPAPSSALLEGRIAEESERRPLIVESLIALRRTTSTYDEVLQQFSAGLGDRIREYVFRREWDVIAASPYARHLLTALAISPRPLTIEDLETILTIDVSSLTDAISIAREMFIQVNDVGDKTSFDIASLTRAFVLKEAKQLPLYQNIKKRVELLFSDIVMENPTVNRLRLRMETHLAKYNRSGAKSVLVDAFRELREVEGSASVAEHPKYKSLLGWLHVSSIPPKLNDARDVFTYCLKMKYEPEFQIMRLWFDAEKKFGTPDWCSTVADTVISGKSYNRFQMIEMKARKASNCYFTGLGMAVDSPIEAAKMFMQALDLHLQCFSFNVENSTEFIEQSEQHVTNTAHKLLQHVSSGKIVSCLETMRDIVSIKHVQMDPIEMPIIENLRKQKLHLLSRAVLQRSKNILGDISGSIGSSSWVRAAVPDRLKQVVQQMVVEIDKEISRQSS